MTMDQNGITITDANGNTRRVHGRRHQDRGQESEHDRDDVERHQDDGSTGNVIVMSDSEFTMTAKVPLKIDATGQTVTVIGSTIDLQKG